MDMKYLLMLQSFREATHGLCNAFFSFITQFGDTALPVSVVIIFYYAVDKKLGRLMLFGNGTALFMNTVLKLTACVYRPWIRDSRIVPAGNAITSVTGYSFPSGHSSIATGVYGTAAVYYRKRAGLCTAFIVLLALIMFSRNYLGVHTPQDVAAGFCVTAVLVLIISLGSLWVENGKNRDYAVLAATVFLVICSLIYFSSKSYPMDYTEAGKLIVDPANMIPDSFYAAGFLLGIVAGWIVERRFIRFSTEVSTETRVLRCISGLLVFYALNSCGIMLAAAVTGINSACFIGAFVMMFYVTAVHPLLFTHFERIYGKKTC